MKIQTKKQALTRLKKMMKQANQYMTKEAERLLNSGAIDMRKYEDNYILPKVLLSAVLYNTAQQYLPFDKEAKKELENLKKF